MSTLKQLVIDEATKLKLHATTSERDMLSFESLNPDKVSACIYGQMTGNCWSERATFLMNTCASPYAVLLSGSVRPNSKIFSVGASRDFSPIEVFIAKNNETANHLLISFIKGQKETLTIDEI